MEFIMNNRLDYIRIWTGDSITQNAEIKSELQIVSRWLWQFHKTEFDFLLWIERYTKPLDIFMYWDVKTGIPISYEVYNPQLRRTMTFGKNTLKGIYR
jgi:hypothetical protein